MIKKVLFTGFILITGLIVSCDMGTEPEDENGNGNGTIENVSFSDDVQPIFNNNCTGCHPSNGGLSLEASESYGNLVGVTSQGYAPLKRVVASKPDSSVLYQKLLANPDLNVGQRMPQGGSLSSDQIETILVWIAEGAQDN
ncbi:MAG: cytochrome c [Candidatus Marinimicrobia bacterium]|nr:cytochrome c [Candidatus Neomarinimicrobiota bacterium]MCF7829747.1 cytochrome c [Candidatus Neomarinimicrobiota bacterium]MCF7881697.1 cytochrome c [Candidatus Neomarinimicrobiota bacterium]